MSKLIWISATLVTVVMLARTTPAEESIHWVSIDRIDSLYAKEPRPILVDVYTSWCGWCKVMDKKTYTNSELAAYLNGHFYAVKFDAEYKGKVRFNAGDYNYSSESECNTLAVYLLAGKMQYPTTVFLSSPGAAPAPIAGYLKPGDIETPMKYFGEKANEKLSYEEFAAGFTSSWN